MEGENILPLPDLSQAMVLDQEIDKVEAWHRERLGKFTSSELGRLMTYEDKINELPKGAISYIEEKVLEIMTDGKSVKNFTSPAMDRGNEKEVEAVRIFENKFGFKCYKIGEDQEFIKLSSYFGGTPDGLINDDALIEVKCPNCDTHLFRIKNIKNQTDFKKHEKGYYWQIQGNLLATGRKKAFFIDYDDRFSEDKLRLLVVEIHRNEDDVEKIKTRLSMAEKYKQQLLNDW